MADHLVATRYAAALSDVLEDNATLEQADAMLASFASLLAEHHDLRSCLLNPSLDVEKRFLVLDEILDAMDIQGSVRRLLHELLKRDRMGSVMRVHEAFAGMVDLRLNRILARVTTRLPMTPEQSETLRQALSRYAGKEVRMLCGDDPDLLGGVVVRMGGELLDGSFKTRLANIRKHLIEQPL